MSAKTAKKQRQLYRRTIKGEVEKMAKAFQEDVMGDQPPFKVCPKFIPNKVWMWLIRTVANEQFITKWYGGL